VKAKLVEWLMRYLPLEIAATACALAGGLGAAALVTNAAVIAYAATWAENAGFYGYALLREMRRNRSGTGLSLVSIGQALVQSTRAILTEFGPAEVLDSFVVRPACMLVLPQATGNLPLGLLLGKILADLAFYGLAAAAFEWSKTRR
jgi:hypothetical protein